jgi:hypothetical protein
MGKQLAGASEREGRCRRLEGRWWEMLSGTDFGGVARLGRCFPLRHFVCRTTHYRCAAVTVID